jgi:hypothetical protein
MPYIYKHREQPEKWVEYRKRLRHPIFRPFLFVEWSSEWLTFLLSRWAVLELLEYVGTLSILIGVIAYFAEAKDRREQKHYQAWLVIDAAQGKSGNGGRLSALEELNSDGVPLVNIDVSDGYFRGIDLHGADLSRAKMSGADMREAVLNGTNLTDAVMVFTNLRGASLREADLNGADLSDADLMGADLGGVRDWKAIGNIARANINGVRNPPEGFVDWAKSQGAVEEP